MADMGDYCWVVICKNRRFHNHENLFCGHQIMLGETDAYSPQPQLDGDLLVRCDECGKEYAYAANEGLTAELNGPVDFRPHPLFPF